MAGNLPTLPLRKIKSLPGFVVNYLLCGPFNKDGKISSCRALDKDYISASGSESTAEPRAGLQEGPSGQVWTPYAIRKGLGKPIGSLTQMGTIRLGKRTDKRIPMIRDFVPLSGLEDLVFGGWDILCR